MRPNLSATRPNLSVQNDKGNMIFCLFTMWGTLSSLKQIVIFLAMLDTIFCFAQNCVGTRPLWTLNTSILWILAFIHSFVRSFHPFTLLSTTWSTNPGQMLGMTPTSAGWADPTRTWGSLPFAGHDLTGSKTHHVAPHFSRSRVVNCGLWKSIIVNSFVGTLNSMKPLQNFN